MNKPLKNNCRYISAEMRIDSSPDEIVHIARIIRWIAVELKFTTRRVDEIELAVVEAMNNAMKHANNMNTSDQVTVKWYVDDNSLKIEVLDQGKSMQAQPAGSLPSANKINGRGWFLISACMDEAMWSPKYPGNRVLLVKHFTTNQKSLIHSIHNSF